MHRLIVASLATAFCTVIAQVQVQAAPAQPAEANGMLSLAQALAMAGVSAPQIESAAADVRGAAAARTVAGLRPNPEFSVEAENIAGSGIYSGSRNLETTAAIAVPIELGKKRTARIGVAEARARLVVIQAAIVQADLRHSVKQAYAEAVAAQKKLMTVQDRARIAAEGLRAARVRVEAGRASPIEIQRADVAWINAQGEAERADRQMHLALSTLSRLIGQPVAGTLEVSWFTDIRSKYGPSPDADIGDTLAAAAAEAELAVAAAGTTLARSQRIPDLKVGAGARYIRETGDTAAVVSLSVPLPLFQNGKAAVSQATAERQSAEARKRIALLDVEQAIERAKVDVANAAASAKTARGPALAASEEAARIARIGYREGKFSQLDLLDAERTLAGTRLEAIDALLNYHNAQAQLERLTTRVPDILGD